MHAQTCVPGSFEKLGHETIPMTLVQAYLVCIYVPYQPAKWLFE